MTILYMLNTESVVVVVGGGEGITLNLHKITPDIKREAELQGFKRGKITPGILREA